MREPEIVDVQISYPSDNKAVVEVKPREVTIYYNRDGVPQALPRSVRWKIRGTREGDRVVVRPKPRLDAQLKTLFKPSSNQDYFEATSAEDRIDCGPPDCGTGSWDFPLEWEYDVIVRRNGSDVGICDPIVRIEEDPYRRS